MGKSYLMAKIVHIENVIIYTRKLANIEVLGFFQMGDKSWYKSLVHTHPVLQFSIAGWNPH